jgi:hypothetical protein
MKTELVKRTIHYYELEFDFNENFVPEDGNQFRELFKIIIQLAKTRAKIRYQKIGEKAVFIQDVKIEPDNKVIIGKLRSVRKDILPEIMNTETDEARGIEAKAEEGLVETVHFVIDYSKKKKKLAFEYNQFGAKITDFIYYLNVIGISKEATQSIGYNPIVKDELSKMKDRINRCSEFFVKIHKDNIEQIKGMDKKLYSSLKSAIDHFKTDYASLKLKFDYRRRTETNAINKTIFNLINKLVEDKSKTEYFNTLCIKAEDDDKRNRLENFDLLIDKIRSEIKVQKKERYRTVISSDIFEKMKDELNKKKI